MEHNTQTLEQIQDFKGKYPKQLWYLFFSEMWERFAFYGMRGMLVFFMVHELTIEEMLGLKNPVPMILNPIPKKKRS